VLDRVRLIRYTTSRLSRDRTLTTEYLSNRELTTLAMTRANSDEIEMIVATR